MGANSHGDVSIAPTEKKGAHLHFFVSDEVARAARWWQVASSGCSMSAVNKMLRIPRCQHQGWSVGTAQHKAIDALWTVATPGCTAVIIFIPYDDDVERRFCTQMRVVFCTSSPECRAWLSFSGFTSTNKSTDKLSISLSPFFW